MTLVVLVDEVAITPIETKIEAPTIFTKYNSVSSTESRQPRLPIHYPTTVNQHSFVSRTWECARHGHHKKPHEEYSQSSWGENRWQINEGIDNGSRRQQEDDIFFSHLAWFDPVCHWLYCLCIPALDDVSVMFKPHLKQNRKHYHGIILFTYQQMAQKMK